jgi:Putative auto-transporter adhesin, head GIN domain
MKTSKLIFISLVGTIALLILAAMLDLRINGRKFSDINSDFKVKKQSIKLFKTLYITNSMNVTLVNNDSSFLEITCLKDSVAPKVNFSINEDTLKISDFETLSHHSVSIRIHASTSLKRIHLKSSSLTLESFSTEELSLTIDKSNVFLMESEPHKSRIHFLEVLANNHSNIYGREFYVDSMGISLQHSEVSLEGIANKLGGTLSDSSRIQARQPLEIWLKKDATSRINISDY